MAIASIKVKMRIGFQEDKDMFKKVIFSIIVISLLSITGCQDTSEKILGSWKSVSPSGFDGKTAVIVFEKNELTANGNYSSSVKYKNDSDNLQQYGKGSSNFKGYAYDKLVVYLDKNLWSIEFIDNDTIMVINGSGGLSSKTKYVRTTHEEAESINEKNNEPRKTSGRIW